MLNNPSSESQPRAPYTSSWQEEKLGTAGIGKLRLPRQRRKVGQGELDRTAPGLSASESGPVGRGGEREVLPRVKSVTPAAGQTTGEVWRKITRNMGGHMPSRGWAGPGLGEKGGRSAVSSQPPIYSGARSNFRNPKRWADNRGGHSQARHSSPSSLLSPEGRDAWRKGIILLPPTDRFTEQAKEGTLEPTLLRPLSREGALGEPGSTGSLPTSSLAGCGLGPLNFRGPLSESHPQLGSRSLASPHAPLGTVRQLRLAPDRARRNRLQGPADFSNPSPPSVPNTRAEPTCLPALVPLEPSGRLNCCPLPLSLPPRPPTQSQRPHCFSRPQPGPPRPPPHAMSRF